LGTSPANLRKGESDVSAEDHRRVVSRLLSGYLCGFRSGLRSFGRTGRRGGPIQQVASLHRALPEPSGQSRPITLGALQWQPAGEDSSLAEGLRRSLAHSGIVDLILYGSQARGGLTGFSDVDAVLVLEDAVAEDTHALRELRPRVLAAQRAVLAYQPMQHHAFEVATAKLLGDASEALGLPIPALSDTRSLNGSCVEAYASGETATAAKDRLHDLAVRLEAQSEWPRHAGRVHGLVAMFELVPVIYLHACGVSVAKAESFEEARSMFGRSWWPYDVLRDIRLLWPRERHVGLEVTCRLVRNPWAAVTLWHRLPAKVPGSVQSLLSARCLAALQALTRGMLERLA
jgi:hypothetical protein